jgi:hypothetical protein
MLHCIPCKRELFSHLHGNSVGSVFECGLRGPGSIHGNVLIFLIILSVMVLETVRCHLLFTPLCFSFFPLLISGNKRSAVGFSM